MRKRKTMGSGMSRGRRLPVLLSGLILILASSVVGCAQPTPPSPPTIAFTPSSLSFSAEESEVYPSSRTLAIWNSGGGTLDWTVTTDANWVSLSPTTGVSAAYESDSVTVLVDMYGMDAGNYASIIAISAPGASNTPQTMAVSLTIEQVSTEYVYINGAILVGADGHRIVLRNNLDAENPTWDELKAFLAMDKTDKIPYDRSTFVCADFAEMVHNNAEAAGMRAAYVCVQLRSEGGHALNAFETTDQGLVYIDCTGPLPSACYGMKSYDKTVDVSVGKLYYPKSIFPEPDKRWAKMGTIEEIETIQW